MVGIFSGIETTTGLSPFVPTVNFTCWRMLDSQIEPSSRVRAFQVYPDDACVHFLYAHSGYTLYKNCSIIQAV